MEMSDPQRMLPEEAWILIFNCLENPMDISSCLQACTLFKNSLSPTRTTWAFPLIFPSLHKYLPKTDVLQCRLVSKSWVKVIDNFLQSDQFASILVQHLRNYENASNNNFLIRIPKHKPHSVPIGNMDRIANLDRIAYRRMGQIDALIGRNVNAFLANEVEDPEPEVLDLHQPHNLRIVNFHRANQVRLPHAEQNRDNLFVDQREDLDPEPEILDLHQNQLQEFISVFGDNYEKNPFSSRAVVLIITDTETEHTLQFLDLFGAHIWSLGIVVQLASLGMYQVLQLIWKLLSRVPNLKHLYFGELSGHVHSFQGVNLNAFLTTCTTPDLIQLKWIELSISNLNMQDIIVEAFGSRSLTIFGFPGGIRPHHISANDWKHLNLELYVGASTWEWDMHLTSFKHLHLPLESIDLRYPKCEDLKSIFDNLTKYNSTLRRLTLTFTNLGKKEFVEMKKKANGIFTSFLPQMKCLDSFKLVVSRKKFRAGFR